MEKIKEVNRVFLITVIVTLVFSIVFAAIPQIGENQLLSLLCSQLIYAVPMLLYLIRMRENPAKALRIHRISPVTILLLVLFAYMVTPLLSLLNLASMLFASNIISSSIGGITTSYPLWVSIVAIGLVPAVLEECVYRGVFFNEYRKQNPRVGVLVSGLLFGLMHMNFNQFMYAFVMGVIFALLVEATNSLGASILVHFTINTNSVVLSWKNQGGETEYTRGALLEMVRLLALPAIVATVFAFGVLLLIAIVEKRKEALLELLKGENKKRGTVITLPLLFGMGICVLLMIYVEIVSRLTP
jgi:hypothetical protein